VAIDTLGSSTTACRWSWSPGDHATWLDASGGAEVALALLRSTLAAELEAVPITTKVNNVRCDGPSLLERVEVA